MGKAMTDADFGVKKLSFARAIELAEGEYHSASFKLSTGSGTAEAVTAAKSHLAAVKGQLEDIEAAWVASAAAAERDEATRKAAAFKLYQSEVDGLLADRRAALESVLAASAAAAAGILKCQKLSEAVRTKSAAFHGNAGAGSANVAMGLNIALDHGTETALMAASAAFGDALIKLAPGQTSLECFGSLGALGFEDRKAERVRSAVAGFAPKQGAQ